MTLYEILIYLYDNKNIGVYPVLEKINGESETIESIEREGIIWNIQSLLIRAAENNDVKMLSSFSYFLSNQFQERKKRNNDDAPEEYKLDVEDEMIIIEVDYPGESHEVNSGGSDENNLFYGSIFILLQTLLKSIELTHYKTTGFLIKFLVTNYDSKTFNSVFKKFYNSPYENFYLLKTQFYKDIDDDFHFNINVKEYLLVKLFILVYAQQIYIVDNKVNFWKLPDERLEPSQIANSEYLKYMFVKLDKAKNQYGLIWLEDKEFVENLKKEFGLHNDLANSSQ